MAPTHTGSDFLITSAALPGFVFRTSSGWGGTTPMTKRRNTPGGPVELVKGRTEFKDVTTGIAESRDVVTFKKRLAAGETFDGPITRVACDRDGTPVPGSELSFTAAISDFGFGDTDVDSNDPSDITVVWTIGSVI